MVMSPNNQVNISRFETESQAVRSSCVAVADGVLTEGLLHSSVSCPVVICPQCSPVSISLSRKRLPAGYRFFPDDVREESARLLEWAMSRRDRDAWFVTHTFKDYIKVESAERLYSQWVGRLKQSLRDLNGSSWLNYIQATELQRRGVVHFHSILLECGLHSLSRKRWEDRWKNESGGFCRIYDAEHGAAAYLAKELNKTLGTELLWGGAWREQPPKSVNVSTMVHMLPTGHSGGVCPDDNLRSGSW